MTVRVTLAALVDSLQSGGRYTVCKRELLSSLSVTPETLKNALPKLERKGRIARLRNGLYAIVPVEYRSKRISPPTWFIHQLMAFLGRPYYVGLLTAAELHGAAHQRPQEFQVVTDVVQKPIEVAGLRIRFIRNAQVARAAVVELVVQTGPLRVSTPEATALDIVRYPLQCGGLNNVATVLTELAEKLEAGALLSAAKSAGPRALPSIQRLGHLLDIVGQRALTGPLAAWVAGQAPAVTPLRSGRPWKGCPRDVRWAVAVNVEVEPDL